MEVFASLHVKINWEDEIVLPIPPKRSKKVERWGSRNKSVDKTVIILICSTLLIRFLQGTSPFKKYLSLAKRKLRGDLLDFTVLLLLHSKVLQKYIQVYIVDDTTKEPLKVTN